MVFCIPYLSGLVCFAQLICLHCVNSTDDSIRATGFTFSKLKLILMYIFGIGNMFHSGLYAWKHSLPEDCPDNSLVDLAYEILSIFYTFITFLYFGWFYDRRLEHSVSKSCALFGIFVANICIWLNAILFASDFLTKSPYNINNSSAMTNVTSSFNAAEEAIEKTNTFLIPAMVEFSLMATDMLFTNNATQVTPARDISNERKYFLVVSLQIVFSLIVFLFFSFVFVVVLTTNSFDEFSDHPNYFNFYVWFQAIMKLLMLVFTLKCLHIQKNVLNGRPNCSSFILISTTVVNSVYHVFYCVAIGLDEGLNPSISISGSLMDNIVSMPLAVAQTLLIVGNHLQDYASPQWSETYLGQYCFILGVLNLGLWITDSIGAERLRVLSIAYHWAYKKLPLYIIYTIIFPFTTFFRFQTGLDFIQFYWEHRRFVG